MDSSTNLFTDLGAAAYLSDTEYAYPNRQNQCQAACHTAFERGYFNVGLSFPVNHLFSLVVELYWY